MRWSFVIYAEPVAKARPRFARSKAGRMFAYTPSRTRNAEDTLRNEALKHIPQPSDKPIRLSVDVYLPRPKRLIWKKRPMPVVPCPQRPDLDNYIKTVEDALQGVAWKDDAQIVYVVGRKMYCPGPGFGDVRPRWELTIVEIEEGEKDVSDVQQA